MFALISSSPRKRKRKTYVTLKRIADSVFGQFSADFENTLKKAWRHKNSSEWNSFLLRKGLFSVTCYKVHHTGLH